MSERPVVASFGGGVNSTAMLLGLYERGERPDLILFADTGGEKPETYAHFGHFSGWLRRRGFPVIQRVSEERWTLEQECLDNHTLPSIAFGFRSCSDKFKIRPITRYLKAAGITDHVRLIGFDANEAHRIKVERPNNRYPLIEWQWDRAECIEAIHRHDLEVPPKSSCFFCPEMKEHEILDLQRKHPDLLNRALAMEINATKLIQIKGLARTHSWQQVIDFHENQGRMLLPPRANEMPCICYDGDNSGGPANG